MLKKIQNEKKVLDEVFGDLADPMASGGSIINRGKLIIFFHKNKHIIYKKKFQEKNQQTVVQWV